MKRIIAIVALLGALGLVIYWVADGANWFDVDQVRVEKTDELFGTKSYEWVDEPHVGLLPVLGPVAGGLAVVGVVLMVMSRKKPAPTKQD